MTSTNNPTAAPALAHRSATWYGLAIAPVSAPLIAAVYRAFAGAQRTNGGTVRAVFAVAGLLTLFYLRYRDLVANVTAHILTTFILNVPLPLAGS